MARLRPDDRRPWARRGAALAAEGDRAGAEAAYAEARQRGAGGALADRLAHEAEVARLRTP